MEFLPLNEKDYELINSAKEVLKMNFDDGIYRHTVGAAIRCANGNVYKGVNCDGIHGSCAEYITIGTAISAGERDFDTIVAVHDGAEAGIIPPCGNCRQMLFEYSPDIKVILSNGTGQPVKINIRELLPMAWEPVIIP